MSETPKELASKLRAAKRGWSIAKTDVTEAQLDVANADAAFAEHPSEAGESLCEKTAANLVGLKIKLIEAKLAFERAEIAFTDATDGWRK